MSDFISRALGIAFFDYHDCQRHIKQNHACSIVSQGPDVFFGFLLLPVQLASPCWVKEEAPGLNSL